MTDNETPQENAQANTEAPQGNFALQRIYVKDISFESPNSPEIFQKQWAPEVKMDLATKSKKVVENIYEVVISVTLTTTVAEMTAYIIEVQQAGVFMVRGLDGAQLAQTLNAYCPNLLFPYLRETIDAQLVKGSFPPAMLAPMNFDAVYAQALRQQQQEAAEAADDSTAH